MEAVFSFETLVNYTTTQTYIIEDGALHRHHCRNFKFKIINYLKETGTFTFLGDMR
jgi:hypothetical protein